jgi:monoamine oxidase
MITRRQFTHGLAVSTLALGALKPKSAVAQEKLDVIVVGAGLSGLYAANMLESQGLKVQVLEAQDHVGGRLYTLRTNDGFFNCGATTLDAYYGRTLDIAQRAGVELTTPGRRASMGFHVNGQLIARDKWEKSSANKLAPSERAITPDSLEFPIMVKLNQVKDFENWAAPEMLKYDIPLDQFYREGGVSEEAIRLIDHIANVSSAANASALFQMREIARAGRLTDNKPVNRPIYEPGDDVRFWFVKGGTVNLAEKIVPLLKRPPLLATPVTAIDLREDGVEVRTFDGKRFQAKYVLCCVPFTSLKRIAVTPNFTGAKREAILEAQFCNTLHVFLRVKQPYWDDIGDPGLFHDGILERAFAGRDAATGEVTWLDVWVNGRGADWLDTLPEKDLGAFVVRKMAEIRPSTKGKLEPIASFSWGKQPFIGTHKHIFGPGQVGRFAKAVGEPWGRMHFAGEHTRILEAGMESACESAERESFALIEKLL